MGFTFNGKHSDELGVCVRTTSMPYIASKRQAEVEVQGRDGVHIFEDGYNNIQIQLACAITDDTILDRRKTARQIAVWLAATGVLVFDYEPDIEYNVIKVPNGITISPDWYRLPIDEFDITFECEPYQKQTFYNDNLTLDEMDSAWKYTDIPWNGYERTFVGVIDDQTLTIENLGTYKALPIIKLTGTAATVTFGGFTFITLSGTVYIDCKNQVVYSISGGSKVNEISKFTGDFPVLDPGTNTFVVTGTITNLTVEFDYKNTYL